MKKLPCFNDDMVNFSSPDYSSNDEGKQSITKKVITVIMVLSQLLNLDLFVDPRRAQTVPGHG